LDHYVLAGEANFSLYRKWQRGNQSKWVPSNFVIVTK